VAFSGRCAPKIELYVRVWMTPAVCDECKEDGSNRGRLVRREHSNMTSYGLIVTSVLVLLNPV